MSSPATAPQEQPNPVMYCYREADGTYHHFYPSAEVVRLCGFTDEIVRVRLVPQDEGDYWCWHDYESNEYCMVQPSLSLLQMCFTYGIKVEEERAKGIRVRVRVVEVPEDRSEVQDGS